MWRSPIARDLIGNWPVFVGLAVLAAPTLVSLGEQVWVTEVGAQGPIVLITGLWLLLRKGEQVAEAGSTGPLWLTVLTILLGLALYVFGRAYDFISLEVAGLLGVALGFAISYFGLRALAGIWFPILYLGFVIPPPGWLIDSVTAPLKTFISYVATGLLQLAGVPIVREGVTLTVGQYQLLVEDACSGMNSLTGLVAISLFYIYLARSASVRYSIFLVCLVIPIAIAANIIRIIILVLLTYYAGDAVAQGFLHVTAGLFLFATALILVFAIDQLFSHVLHRRRVTA